MPVSKPAKVFTIADAIAKSESVVQGPGLYSNHAQMSITNNEIILDFYEMAPTFKDFSEVKATHIQRIIIPHSLGKGFATALANLINHYEEENGQKLPNQSPDDPSLKIKIWE